MHLNILCSTSIFATGEFIALHVSKANVALSKGDQLASEVW